MLTGDKTTGPTGRVDSQIFQRHIREFCSTGIAQKAAQAEQRFLIIASIQLQPVAHFLRQLCVIGNVIYRKGNCAAHSYIRDQDRSTAGGLHHQGHIAYGVGLIFAARLIAILFQGRIEFDQSPSGCSMYLQHIVALRT